MEIIATVAIWAYVVVLVFFSVLFGAAANERSRRGKGNEHVGKTLALYCIGFSLGIVAAVLARLSA